MFTEDEIYYETQLMNIRKLVKDSIMEYIQNLALYSISSCFIQIAMSDTTILVGITFFSICLNFLIFQMKTGRALSFLLAKLG